MRKPDRSLVNDIFGSGMNFKTSNTRPSATKPTSKPKTQQKKSSSMGTNRSRFEAKLAEEDFHEFDQKDWVEYFKWKAEQHGIKYLVGHPAKEQSIIKSLMSELHWDAIKGMIDFLFDSNQDIVPKRTAGIVHLSKGWANTIYQSSQLWLEGTYKTRAEEKNPPKRNREWQEPVAASRKETGTGINYGKPIRDTEPEDKPKPTTKPKGKVSF